MNTPRSEPRPSPDGAPTPRERRLMRAFDDVFTVEEPLPPRLVEAARDLYVWRSVDAELLELLVDSAEQDLTAVRSSGSDHLQRFMAFGNDERGVHFECTADDSGGFLLEGMVVPAGSYLVRADRPGTDLAAETDEHGAFVLRALDIGSTRLTVRAVEGDLMMTTPWFMLRR